MDSLFLLIIGVLAVAVIIITAIVAVIGAFLRSKKRHFESSGQNWYLQVALSRKDALSQWLLVLGGLAAANAIYTINNNFASFLSWQSVLLGGVLVFAAAAYFGKSVYCAAIGIIGFLVWWAAQTAAWQSGAANVYYVASIPAGLMWLAIFLYAAGFMQAQRESWRRFSIVYTFVGILLANLLLFIFSTQSGLLALGTMTSGMRLFDSWQNTVSLFIVGAITAMLAAYAWSKKIILEKEAIAMAALFLIFGVIVALPDQQTFSNGVLAPAGIAWAAVMNFALFVEILGLIFAGYFRREIWMVNVGAIFLIIFVAVKYFDWFFKFLDKSVFFIIAGILLFVVGWAMERGRKFLAQTIKSQTNQ
ncbi:MAG: hypothetical protein WCX69_03640 [Candidatus Paceibacterota bacterium]